MSDEFDEFDEFEEFEDDGEDWDGLEEIDQHLTAVAEGKQPQTYVQPKGEAIFYKGKKYKPEQAPDLALSRLTDKEWRLDNLYSIINEHSELVPFRLRPIQRHFLRNMWYRNLILKSRQHGFTTFINLWTLDTALFTPNFTGIIISHKKEDSSTILQSKVSLPYSNMHHEILSRVGVVSQSKGLIEFTNGSSIRVTTSGRSGTASTLHISEYGYISKHRPDVAEEIKIGSLPAVHEKGFVFIESTSDGPGGQFYDMVMTARNRKAEGRRLTPFDFKFFFYAWYDKPDNELSDKDLGAVNMTPEMITYLDGVEKEVGVTLSQNQREWYAVQQSILEEKIFQEHPSTPSEAFNSSSEGYYFYTHMTRARADDRLVRGIPARNQLVQTYWDIGVSDATACWFVQRVGEWFHVLGYYEETDLGMDHHIPAVRELAREKGWALAPRWVGPHDMRKRSPRDKMTLVEDCAKLGAEFAVVPKISQKILSINAARRILPACKFDLDGPGMELGIARLDNYRRDWDKVRMVWSDKPRHDDASHGADAFQTFAMFVESDEDDSAAPKARPDPRFPSEPGVAQRGGRGPSLRSATL